VEPEAMAAGEPQVQTPQSLPQRPGGQTQVLPATMRGEAHWGTRTYSLLPQKLTPAVKLTCAYVALRLARGRAVARQMAVLELTKLALPLPDQSSEDDAESVLRTTFLAPKVIEPSSAKMYPWTLPELRAMPKTTRRYSGVVALIKVGGTATAASATALALDWHLFSTIYVAVALHVSVNDAPVSVNNYLKKIFIKTII
jgi:hypothetical protein